MPLLFVPFLLKALHEPPRHAHLAEAELEPSLLPVYLTAFFVMVLFYMLPTQLPYLIVDHLGGKARSVGFVIATAMLFNALTAMQYAILKKRFSYLRIYAFTFGLFTIGLFFIARAESVAELFFATMPIGAAFGLLLVNTNAWFLSKCRPPNGAKPPVSLPPASSSDSSPRR